MPSFRFGGGFWNRPAEPPPPTDAGRDVSERVLRALRWALHGTGDHGERDPGTGGAVAAAAGAYVRAFSAAEVAAAEPTAAAVLEALPAAGRAYVERGEATFLPTFSAEGAMALEQVAVLDASGTREAPRWKVRRYRPGGKWRDAWYPGDRLLRCVWNPDEATGGLMGAPPWVSAAARALVNVEGQAGDLGSLPTGHSMRIHSPAEWDDAAVLEYLEGARLEFGPANRSRFATLLVQGPAETESFLDTYTGQHPQPLPQLVAELATSVALACGLPAALISGEAASHRDVWRSFLASSAQPVADQFARAAARHLGVPVAVAVTPRQQTPADLVSRSRAVRSLQEAGVDTERALTLAGLE